MDGMVDETSNVLCAAGVTMFEHLLVFPVVEDPTTVRLPWVYFPYQTIRSPPLPPSQCRTGIEETG
jgi:hypothetical protein